MSLPTSKRRLVTHAVAISMALAAGGLLLYLGRNWSFFFDEWVTILHRRKGGLDAFLAPHNGHLQAVVFAVYRALFAVVGLRSYLPYQAVAVGLHLVLVTLLFAYARRRLPLALAALLSITLLLLGQAWEVLLWAVNLSFVVPLIALLAILNLRDREVRGEAVVTPILLLLALASSGLGIAVAVVALIDTVTSARSRARLAAVIAPLVAYAGWFLWYRPGASPSGSSNLDDLPEFAARMAQAALAAPLGSNYQVPQALLPFVAAALVTLVLLAWRSTHRPRVLAFASGALTFWLLTALARADVQHPQASRYVYPGVLLLLLVAVEALAGRRPPAPVVALIAVVVVVGAGIGMRELQRVGNGASEVFAVRDARLASIECAVSRSRTEFVHPPTMPGVRVGPYLAAVRDLGSPIDPHCRAAMGP